MNVKNLLLTLAAMGCMQNASAKADLPTSFDISSILLKDANLSLGLTFPGEMAQHGVVIDVNNDGIQDFIVTGLYTDGDAQKAFFRVYEGVKNGTPKLVYDNLEFPIGGNGSIDAFKDADGNTIVGVNGGALGNWTNPFKMNIYKLTSGTEYSLEEVANYQGTGRGTLLFLDINNDGWQDIYQNGWVAANDWSLTPGIFVNDQTNSWWDEETYDEGTEPIRMNANTRVTRADVNKDGKMDLMMPIQGTGLYVYLNNGDGTFDEKLITPFSKEDRADGSDFRSEDDATQAEFIDFNNDGYPDIVLLGTNDATGGDWEFRMELYKNNGDGTFSLQEQKTLAGAATTLLGGQRADIAVADFNQDGNQDLIIGCENQTNDGWKCVTMWMPGNGQGGFDQYNVTYNADTNPNGIVAMSRRANFGQYLVGDFNGDGTPDLVSIGNDYYAKNGDLRFYANQSTPVGNGINSTEKTSVIVEAVEGGVAVSGAEGQSVIVVTPAGQQVATVAKASSNLRMNLAKGMYLVKAGNTAVKVIVK